MNFYCFYVWTKHGWPTLHSSTAMGTAPPGLSKIFPSATPKCVGPFQFYDLVFRIHLTPTNPKNFVKKTSARFRDIDDVHVRVYSLNS